MRSSSGTPAETACADALGHLHRAALTAWTLWLPRQIAPGTSSACKSSERHRPPQSGPSHNRQEGEYRRAR